MKPLDCQVIGYVGKDRELGKVEGLIENNVAANVKSPKMSRKVVSTLSDEEIKAILNTLT